MAFQHGLAGINAANNQLGAIGNNIANASTVGYKGSRAEFADMFAANFYGVAATQNGIGVSTTAIAQQFKQGGVTTTGNQLDLAISGNGFFVMQNANGTAYTRNGQFQIDREGYINNNGDFLMGWGVDSAGSVLKGSMSRMKVDTSLLAPRPSDWNNSPVKFGLNLDSRATVPTVAFNAANPTPDMYNSTTSTQIYDSLGNPLTLSTYYVYKGASGTPSVASWDVHAEITDPNGIKTTLTPTPSPAKLTFDNLGNMATSAPPLDFGSYSGSLGAASLAIKLDFTGTTQYGTEFAVNSTTQQGYAPSVMTNLLFAKDGTVTARYSNGQSKTLGQVALANFANQQGLQPIGGNRWIESYTSGNAVINKPGSTNVGLIQSQALEDSNVDMTGELVNMITAQRYYQANAQTIKVEDALMQTLISLR
ncbi:flagellar hook protein FlgE [Microvirgula curvata]